MHRCNAQRAALSMTNNIEKQVRHETISRCLLRMTTIDAFSSFFSLSLFVMHFSPDTTNTRDTSNQCDVTRVTRESEEKRKSRSLPAAVPYFCHAPHTFGEVRQKFLSVEDAPIPQSGCDSQAMTTHPWFIVIYMLVYSRMQCSRGEIQRRLLSDVCCAYQADRVDNTRMLMRLITIRRIE